MPKMKSYNGLLLHIDHFSTFPDTEDIDQYLKDNYENLGFILSDQVVKQNPELISRFVLFTGEYLEFNIVENKEAFTDEKRVTKDLIEASKEHRPYGIGYVAQSIDDIYEHWRVRGYQVEDIAYLIPRDVVMEDPKQDPTWTYIPFPTTYAQGVLSYVIEYKKRKKENRYRFIMGENGIYAVNGVTFVTNYPHNRGEDWSNFFYSKNNHTPYLNECTMDLPPHFIQWITPQKFSMIYKVDFVPTTLKVGELYIIHVFSKDLKYTKEYFESKGKKVVERNVRIGSERLESIIIERNSNDGFFFAVSEKDPEEWLKLRFAKVKEKFEY